MNNYNVSYKQVVDEMNNFMTETGFTQRPELNGDEDLITTKVLGGKKTEGADETSEAAPVPESEPVEEPVTEPVTETVEQPVTEPVTETVEQPAPETPPEPTPLPGQETTVIPDKPTDSKWKRNLMVILGGVALVVASITLLM